MFITNMLLAAAPWVIAAGSTVTPLGAVALIGTLVVSGAYLAWNVKK